MTNVSNKFVEKKKTHILYINNFPFLNRATYHYTRGKSVYSRTCHNDKIKRRMSSAWWVTEATGTHLEYVILTAFPLQQRSSECASILRYIYEYCLSCFVNVSNIKCCEFCWALFWINKCIVELRRRLEKSRSSSFLPDMNTVVATLHWATYAHLS